MVNLNEMSRPAKVMLFTIGCLEDLKAQGYMEGVDTITPKGTAMFDQLEASGFDPTDREIDIALEVLEVDPAAAILIKKRRELE